MTPRAPRMAVLTPYAANLLLVHLAHGKRLRREEVRAHVQTLRERGQQGLVEEVLWSWELLEASARDYRQQVGAANDPSAGGAASVDGSDPAEMAPEAAESGAKAELTTKEAANMLGVTERRVGQLLAARTLPGRRAGRMWLVTREAVEALAQARAVAS